MVISADTDFYAECSAGAGIELGVVVTVHKVSMRPL